ncbi:uncharacterized protein TNCV_560991 [Trichonephila clavipes]|nr:uncharacterized protein TNCV_560991 [Trichonephila clavipes]
MVSGSNSWHACHDPIPLTTGLPQPQGDVEVRRMECRLECYPRHLTEVQIHKRPVKSFVGWSGLLLANLVTASRWQKGHGHELVAFRWRGVKVRRRGTSSCIVLVTRPWLKKTRSIGQMLDWIKSSPDPNQCPSVVYPLPQSERFSSIPIRHQNWMTIPRISKLAQNSFNDGFRVLARHGSLVVKVTDSWPACQEFEPSTAENPPCRGATHIKSVERSNVLPLVWQLGEGGASSGKKTTEQILRNFHSFPPHFATELSLTPIKIFQNNSVAAAAEWTRYRTVAGLVTRSSPVPLKAGRVGERCTLNPLRAQASSRWSGGVVRREGCQLRCRPRHLTMVQNDEVRRQKPSCS